jgi:Transposase domain (DUF772)
VVDAVLADLDDTFDSMYATSGRSSVPPETLLKATVLMAMYSIGSERAFCERLRGRFAGGIAAPLFFGCSAPRRECRGQLTDLALGLPQPAVLVIKAALTLQPLPAGGQELVAPRRQAMRFHAQLPAQHVK